MVKLHRHEEADFQLLSLKEFDRARFRVLLYGFPIVGGLCITFFCVIYWLRSAGFRPEEAGLDQGWKGAIFDKVFGRVLAIVAALVLTAVGITVASRLRFQCPACAKPFIKPELIAETRKTGECPFCSQRILSEVATRKRDIENDPLRDPQAMFVVSVAGATFCGIGAPLLWRGLPEPWSGVAFCLTGVGVFATFIGLIGNAIGLAQESIYSLCGFLICLVVIIGMLIPLLF